MRLKSPGLAAPFSVEIGELGMRCGGGICVIGVMLGSRRVMGWRGGGGGWACNSLTPGISARRSNSVDEAKEREITLTACKLRK